jgi:hypothetical protein
MNKKELPELKKRIEHFSIFLIRTFKAVLFKRKWVLVKNSERKRRLEVCRGNNKKNLDLKDRCKFISTDNKHCTICGCNLSLKSRFKTDRCDIGKWN